MTNKLFYIISVVSILAVAAFLFLNIRSSKSNYQETSEKNENTVEKNGEDQIIKITAKDGYFPNSINAKAETNTKLKITTPGTYDCSVALYIPAINYKKLLPTKGETVIELGKQPKDSTLKGMCSMGMYRFSINFN